MILELRDLCCGYGPHPVLDGVNLGVGRGENLCLLGPNGSGKTTLFRTVLGLIAPLSGEILVEGRNLRDLARRERAKLLAYVPQAHQAPFPLDVRDVVLTGRASYVGLASSPTRRDRRIAFEALEALGIGRLAGRPYTELSGGEQQLVLIARALAQEPRALVMDEPSSHLDFGNQARLLALMRSLASERGIAVLMSAHLPNHAFACASAVALIGCGRIAHVGPPATTLTESTLEEVYGIDIRLLHGTDKAGARVTACVATAV
jgi:iron complex transport system ATP-binding protein